MLMKWWISLAMGVSPVSSPLASPAIRPITVSSPVLITHPRHVPCSCLISHLTDVCIVHNRGVHFQNFGIPLEFQIVGKWAISGKSWNSIGIPIPMIYIFHKISKSNPNPNFWFSIISQSKSQLISEIFGFPIPTYFPTFSVDLFPNSKFSWNKMSPNFLC